MILRHLNDIRHSERNVKAKDWESARMLLKQDGMGFSFHITTLYAGAEIQMQYLNHLESVFILQGKGSIEDLASGDIHQLSPGTMYALNAHDHHVLRIEQEIVCACVFNPPVSGREVHDDNGSYPADSD
ncbi:MAG: ectoine synthase [Methylophilaceae bacterium]|jgi:L-ectoine synthase|nr:MAG: ectoine synthase [Methylophilaceae bacterium]